MRKLSLVLCVLCTFLYYKVSLADVLRVHPKGGISDIQTAVDLACDGDVILVWPGKYQNFFVEDKSLQIIGIKGADKTLIVGTDSPELYRNYEGVVTVIDGGLYLEGFTIEDMRAFGENGFSKTVFVYQPVWSYWDEAPYQLVVQNCRLTMNPDSYGYGIYCAGNIELTAYGNVIETYSPIYCKGRGFAVEHNTMIGRYVSNFYTDFATYYGTELLWVTRNICVTDYAGWGFNGCLHLNGEDPYTIPDQLIIAENLFWNRSGQELTPLWVGSNLTTEYWSEEETLYYYPENVCDNPLFVDIDLGDFELLYDSPAIMISTDGTPAGALPVAKHQ